MTHWTHGEVATIKRMKDLGWQIQSMCNVYLVKGRDEIVECLDALRRTDSVGAAKDHLNSVIALQLGGFPLINGKPAWVVEKPKRPEPMFT